MCLTIVSFSIFYQLIITTIEQKTVFRLEKWILRAMERDDYKPIDDTYLHSASTKDIVEIIFKPLDMVYEIDFTSQEVVHEAFCPKSLVFCYFEAIYHVFVSYLQSLHARTHPRNLRFARAQKICMTNNVQGCLTYLNTILTDEDTAEALLSLSSGKEWSLARIKDARSIPIFRKMIAHCTVVRNMIAYTQAQTVFCKFERSFVELVTKSTKKKSHAAENKFTKFMDALWDEFERPLYALYYPSHVEKIMEYLFVMYMHFLKDYLLNHKKQKDGVELLIGTMNVFVEQLTDMLYAEGEGIPLSILRHYSRSFKSIVRLFKKGISTKKKDNYFITLFVQIRDDWNEDMERDELYYVQLVSLDDDEDEELSPPDLLKIMKKVGTTIEKNYAKNRLKEIKAKEKALEQKRKEAEASLHNASFEKKRKKVKGLSKIVKLKNPLKAVKAIKKKIKRFSFNVSLEGKKSGEKKASPLDPNGGGEKKKLRRKSAKVRRKSAKKDREDDGWYVVYEKDKKKK